MHAFSTFRLSCHNLEIEIGRHKAIDREHRTCPFGCNSIEDEYHFLMGCNKDIEIRKNICLANTLTVQIYINLTF